MNMVKEAPIKTGLAEIPSTPAFRQQAQQQIAQIIQALAGNPQAVAVLAPAYVESMSVANRQQLADDLRKASGVPLAGDKEGQARAEEQQQQALMAQQQAAQAQAQAVTDDKVASAERNRASARQANASAALIEQQIAAGKANAEVAKTVAETDKLQQEAANEDQLIEDALAEAQG